MFRGEVPLNIRAKCVNKQCPAYGIQKSVVLETYAGQGTANERIICRTCQQLMETTRTVDVSAKAPGKRLRVPHRDSSNIKFKKKKTAGRGKTGGRKSSTSKKKI